MHPSRRDADSRQVEQVAVKGAASAEESGDAVRQTVEAMEAKSRPRRPSLKTLLTRRICWRSMLPSQASLRAGDQGRGFAVVAVEVRKLAELEPVGCTRDRRTRGQECVSVAERSGQLLSDLVPAIKKTAELRAGRRSSIDGTIQRCSHRSTRRWPRSIPSRAAQRIVGRRAIKHGVEELAAQSEQLQQLMTFFRLAGEGLQPSGCAAGKS